MTPEEIKDHNIKWYQKTYNELIKKCQEMETAGYPDEIYTEVHHIIPKCMGGTDDQNNLVRMPVRYHVIAHMLLACIYPTNKSIIFAVNVMFNCKEMILNKRVSSRLIAKFKEDFKITLRTEGIIRKDGSIGFKAMTVVCFNKDLSVAKIYYPMCMVEKDGFCKTTVQKHYSRKIKTPYAGYYWYTLEEAQRLFPDKLANYNPEDAYIDPTYKTLSNNEKRKLIKYPDMSKEEKQKRSNSLKGKKKKYTKPKNNIGSSRKILGPDGTIYDNTIIASKSLNISAATLRSWIKKHPEKGFKYQNTRKIIDDKGNIFKTAVECGNYYDVSKQTVRYWEKTGRHGIKYIYE